MSEVDNQNAVDAPKMESLMSGTGVIVLNAGIRIIVLVFPMFLAGARRGSSS